MYLYCPELAVMMSELEQTYETCEQKQAEGQTCNQYFYFRSIVSCGQIINCDEASSHDFSPLQFIVL